MFIILAIFVCGLLFYANAVAFNLIFAPIFISDIITYAALTIAVTLTIITLTMVIRDKRKSLFAKTQKSIVANSNKESIEIPSAFLLLVDSQENTDKVESNPVAVQIANESNKALVTILPKSSRKKNVVAILIAITVGLLLFVNVVSFKLIVLPQYAMYVAAVGAAGLIGVVVVIAIVEKRRGAVARVQKASVVSAVEEYNEPLERVSSSDDFQESTSVVETDKADIQTLNVSTEAQVEVLPKSKLSKKRNALFLFIVIAVDLVFFANFVAFGLISLPGYFAYAFVFGAAALTLITVAVALVDKRRVALPKTPIVEVAGAIKESIAVPETPDLVSSTTIAQTSAEKVESDIAIIETAKIPDKTPVPIAKSTKVFGKRNLFIIIVALTVALLFFANAGAFGLINLPEYSIYAALAGAIAIATIPLTILLGDKIKVLGHRIKGFLAEPDIQEIINEVKEPDQAPDIASAPVIAQTSTVKVDPYSELLRQFGFQKTSRRFEVDTEELEKELPKKPVSPPTKVICPACRKEFSLPFYEREFIVDFGVPKKSNIIEPCFYCGALVPLKRKGDQEEIWKE